MLGKVYSTATFDVLARRTDTRGRAAGALPYFVTVLRGGSAVVTKRLGQVTLNFADGQERAQAQRPGLGLYRPRRSDAARGNPRAASPASARPATPMPRSIR